MKRLGNPLPGERLLRSRGNSRGSTTATVFAAFASEDYENASVPRIYDYTPRRSLASSHNLPDNVVRFTTVRTSRRKA